MDIKKKANKVAKKHSNNELYMYIIKEKKNPTISIVFILNFRKTFIYI